MKPWGILRGHEFAKLTDGKGTWIAERVPLELAERLRQFPVMEADLARVTAERGAAVRTLKRIKAHVAGRKSMSRSLLRIILETISREIDALDGMEKLDRIAKAGEGGE
ncbi:MAG: hypothetical protein V1800_06745 [Candidatus Latescibacterota bacterium]